MGSLVLKINNRKFDRKGGKESPAFIGPYPILDVNNSGAYKLQNISTNVILKTRTAGC